jgi:hypothetical protein
MFMSSDLVVAHYYIFCRWNHCRFAIQRVQRVTLYFHIYTNRGAIAVLMGTWNACFV